MSGRPLVICCGRQDQFRLCIDLDLHVFGKVPDLDLVGAGAQAADRKRFIRFESLEDALPSIPPSFVE